MSGTRDDVASPTKVAILGAGVGAMSAALELTRAEHRGRYEVTVYTLGWRIGGKGASGRGPNGRIEEHGLHVWFGFYENAFRLLRECYDELDRGPEVPIRTIEAAFHPAPRFGVAESRLDRWISWVLTFPDNDEVPGDGKGTKVHTVDRYVSEFLGMALALTRSLWEPIPALQVTARVPAPPPGSTASTAPSVGSPISARVPPHLPSASRVLASAEDVIQELYKAADGVELMALSIAIELATSMELLADWSSWRSSALVATLDDLVNQFEARATATMGDTPSSRRVVEILDATVCIVRGLIVDGVVGNPQGFSVLDDFDLRDWLFLHGARTTTIEGGFVKGLYDLVFAYRGGEPDRASLSAAQGLRGVCRMFFDYKGSFAYRMEAGMGDVVFGPIFELLERRGVRFEFFSEVDELVPGEDGRTIDEVVVYRQAELTAPPYRPLVDVKGLPCWPAAPLWDQLVDEGAGDRRHFETPWPEPERVGAPRRLRRGEDFDEVVFGLSLGSVPTTCRRLVEDREAWRLMVDHVGTVETQALQLWVDTTTAQLFGDPTSPVVAGYVEPFDTWADMTHLLEREDWPASDAPKGIHYFCNALRCSERVPPPEARDTQARADAAVLENATSYLDLDVNVFLPGAVHYYPREFKWDLLCGAGALDGRARLATQHLRANVAPSERYVLSLPGTTRYRLAPADSGYDNLFLAGDWTHVGLDAGCVESAATSGLLAARGLLGAAPDDIEGVGHP